MDSILKFLFALVIPLCPCFAGQVSKACFGSAETVCTYHNLMCSSGSIAIKDAFYMNITNCSPTGISACASVKFSNIRLNGTSKNFNRTELDSLYKSCSRQSTCSIRAGQTRTAGFSAILYDCINETIDMCNVTNIQKKETSLIWRGPSDQNSCLCSIYKPSTIEPTLLTLTPLEMRRHCSRFTVSVDGRTFSRQCSKFTSSQLLLNSTNWKDVTLTVDTRNKNAVFWIEIQGTANLNIVCNESPTTTETASSVEVTTTTSTWTTATHKTIRTSQSFKTSTSSSVPSDQKPSKAISGAESKTGTIVGVIVPLCIIIAGVGTGVIIFRRRKLRQKHKNEVAKFDSKPPEALEKKFSPDYDYATTNENLDVISQTHKMRSPQNCDADDDYYHQVETLQTKRDLPQSHNASGSKNDKLHLQITKNGHYDNTLSVAGTLEGSNANEEVYNHLNEKAVSNINADSTYNTTASTRHNLDSSTNDMEDDYGYNHLGTETKKNLPQSEYDTTASAIRDLARINDSTYDHAYLLTSDSSPSGMTNAGFQESDYDHASTTTAHKDEYEPNALRNRSHQEEGVADVYTLAGEADTNPYQLAK